MMEIAGTLLIALSVYQQLCEASAISLNDNWVLTNENKSIKIPEIALPCGVYSDLEFQNLTESVLFSYNDVNLRWIAQQNWTYSLNIDVSSDFLSHKFLILTFHGLDTVTEIFLNDVFLGATDNMFVRYRFDVKALLIEGENKLVVNFQSPIDAARRLSELQPHIIPPECPPSTYKGECHMNQLRKMQASFAWDWGLAAPSMGIWKDVELEISDTLTIRDITYELTDRNSSWFLSFSVYVEGGKGKSSFEGSIIYELTSVVSPITQHISITTYDDGLAAVAVNFSIPKSSVNLWWPNGYGAQKLYEFRARLEDAHLNSLHFHARKFFTSEKSIKIGFRTIELVQEQMDNGLSFYFRVNKVPMFMKGSNWIPSHILPEKSANREKITALLEAARDAKMNMLRVWGGGVYESDFFYQLADKFGILIWQDMMFACAMYPTGNFLKSVRTEVNQQIRRIQHHPSIALFATNNENEAALRQNWYDTQGKYERFAGEYVELYVDTVTDVIRKVDKSREVLTSSPSNGAWTGDRDTFGISQDPQNWHFGDIHHYALNTNSWRPETFHQARFASEYGFQGYPMGWKDVARVDDDIKELISHRQHHPLNSTLIVFLVQQNLNVEFHSLDWVDQVYLSQVSQAMALKIETEVYRSGRGNFLNTMGALYWQLNDVWVAPSWSSIEFNGNFKIAQYWIQSLFAPVGIITQINLLNKLVIYGVSDEINQPVKVMKVKVNFHKFDELAPVDSLEFKFDMQPNAVTNVETIDLYDYLYQRKLDVYEHFLIFHLFNYANESEILASNFLFPGNYQNLASIRDPNLRISIVSSECENAKSTAIIEVKVDTPAIFVWMTLQHDDVKQFKFSKNGFIQVDEVEKVRLEFKNPNCQWKVTERDLIAKTMNKFMAK